MGGVPPVADANVFVTVTDPDRLMAGTSPYAPFVAAYIQLYRYTSEANARANSGGVLATTFTLVASSTAAADPNIAGPYRFGVYDGNQLAGSVYRYRFADSGLISFSDLSEPWEADNAPSWALRDLLFEIGQELGGKIIKGTATAGSTTTVTCTALFQSTLLDSRFHEGWDLVVSQDAGGAGAAPEGERALIASENRGTGVATLERALTTAVASGDTFLVSALIDFDDLIRIINRTREKLLFVETLDIALDSAEDLYPAPNGVRSEADIVDAVGIMQYANSNREDEFEIDYRLSRHGGRLWLEFSDSPESTPIARLTLLRNYREAEGELLLMSDTTTCPIEWMRPALAFAVAEHLAKESPEEPEYQRLKSDLAENAHAAAMRFGPQVQRRAKTGYGRKVLPGPVAV